MRKLLLMLFCLAISISKLPAQSKTFPGKLSDQGRLPTSSSANTQGDNLAFPGFYNASNVTVLTNDPVESNNLGRDIRLWCQASPI